MRIFSLIASFCISITGSLLGQPTESDEAPAPASPVVAQSGIPADGARVAILGYHDFSPSLKETEMRINTKKFRAQMQFLKDQKLTVISMADFSAWKRGEKSIPARAIVITIDDGWSSVYSDAFPILKEFGYPFTLFLYSKYVNVQGRSLSIDMIKEMQKHGATIGCHSMSHPYPATVKAQRRSGPKTYQQFLDREMIESKKFLETNFRQPITTYCYPGGYHTEEMYEVGKTNGYEHMFTVLPGKITRSSDDRTLPRYVILGTYDRIFDLAVEFRDGAAPAAPGILPKQTVPYPVLPEAGSIVNTRLPLISIDLSKVTDITPETLVMRVAGFGDVPAIWNAETKQLQWQVNRRLRDEVCTVSISWKGLDKKTASPALRWEFLIDKEAAYQPSGG